MFKKYYIKAGGFVGLEKKGEVGAPPFRRLFPKMTPQNQRK